MRPQIKILDEELKEKVFVEAMEILDEIGIFVENEEAIELLQNEGVSVNLENRRTKISPDMVKKALKTAPSSVPLYNREGELVVKLEGNINYLR